MFGRERVRISTDPDPDAAQPAEQVVETQQEDPAPSLPIKGRTPSGRIPAKMRNDELVKQFYKRYQLKWPKLREWLVDKFPEDEFPGVEFKQKFVRTDHFWSVDTN